MTGCVEYSVINVAEYSEVNALHNCDVIVSMCNR